MRNEESKLKWNRLVEFVSNEFGDGEQLDLQAILFLIGIQELGKGYQVFSKEEKMDLLHVAICRLLSNYGYYELEGRDKDGWPHYKTNEKLPALKPGEQTILMKEAAILYFEESGVIF
jgi:high-affinity Fe2+/Pb2+ permease